MGQSCRDSAMPAVQLKRTGHGDQLSGRRGLILTTLSSLVELNKL